MYRSFQFFMNSCLSPYDFCFCCHQNGFLKCEDYVQFIFLALKLLNLCNSRIKKYKKVTVKREKTERSSTKIKAFGGSWKVEFQVGIMQKEKSLDGQEER